MGETMNGGVMFLLIEIVTICLIVGNLYRLWRDCAQTVSKNKEIEEILETIRRIRNKTSREIRQKNENLFMEKHERKNQ